MSFPAGMMMMIEEWTTKELSTKDPCAQFSKINRTMDCLHAEENGLFDGISQMRGFCSQLEIYEQPDWHLFQIRDDWHFSYARAQVGTFGLEECEEDSKHLKLDKSCFRVTDMKFKDTVLLTSSDVMDTPYEFCSTTGHSRIADGKCEY
ncbi:hypothetical protein V6N13_035683 [Hibiscus sabdariffa]|uniref:Uncharacterized protein n=1 Tax=Hibiscus sabdariffa TaxID=183260 RepID=A0ABR2S9F8_9ROSI